MDSDLDKKILDHYRRLYPFLSEEDIAGLRECHRNLIRLGMRQIERLKREGKWPLPELDAIHNETDGICESSDSES